MGMTLWACPKAHLCRPKFLKLVSFCPQLHALMGRSSLPAGPVHNTAVLQAAVMVFRCMCCDKSAAPAAGPVMDVEREREQCRQVDARQHSGTSMGAVAQHGAADPEAATAGEVGKSYC